MQLRDIWPSLGMFYKKPMPKMLKSPTTTKKGPGRRHQRGHQKPRKPVQAIDAMVNGLL